MSSQLNLQAATKARFSTANFAAIYRRFGTILIFVGILIIASLASPDFLTEANLTNVLRQVVVVSLLACGVTFVIILAQIDVSLGSVLALCGVIAASVMTMTGSVFLAVVAGLLVGAITGLVNGLVVTVFNIPSFIMTLAMTTVARGLVLLYTGGSPVSGLGNFRVIGQGALGPVPISVIILAVVAVLSWVLLNKTKFGRYVYAVGGNPRAALASGVSPSRIIVKAFVFNGVLCAVGGIVLMSRINSGQPAGGVGYEFDAITATVVGGTSLMGGIGTVPGVLLGILLLAILQNGLNLLGVSPYFFQIVIGIVILAATTFTMLKFAQQRRVAKGAATSHA
jgi:inositol transport system permease protein